MSSSLRKTKSVYHLSDSTNQNLEECRQKSTEQQTLNILLKSLTILTNVAIGSIVIYNLYYINHHLIDVKDAIENLF